MTDCLEASYKLMTVVGTTRPETRIYRSHAHLALKIIGTKNYHTVEVLVYLGTVRGTSTHTSISHVNWSLFRDLWLIYIARDRLVYGLGIPIPFL